MKDEEDIKVNRKKAEKVYFESSFIQSIYDRVDFLRDEAKEILNDLDSTEFKQYIDEFDFEEFSRDTIDQIDDIVDDLSQVKSNLMDDESMEMIKNHTNQFKRALNRDVDYVRRAKRKLNKINSSDGIINEFKVNIRVVELCDKAIEVNNHNWEAYYVKGLALINLEKYGEAIEEFISALALNDEITEARLHIGNAYRLNKEYESSIDAYDSVLNISENSFEALKGKAYTYVDWEKYVEADEFFKKANSVGVLDEESKAVWDEISKKI